MKTINFPTITDEDLQQLELEYPDYIPAGSPYDTGYLNSPTPQIKRLSSFVGDFWFQAPRRTLIDMAANRGQNVWSYQWKR